MSNKLRKGHVRADKELDRFRGLAFIFGINLNTKCPLTLGLLPYVEGIAPDLHHSCSANPSKMTPSTINPLRSRD